MIPAIVVLSALAALAIYLLDRRYRTRQMVACDECHRDVIPGENCPHCGASLR